MLRATARPTSVRRGRRHRILVGLAVSAKSDVGWRDGMGQGLSLSCLWTPTPGCGPVGVQVGTRLKCPPTYFPTPPTSSSTSARWL